MKNYWKAEKRNCQICLKFQYICDFIEKSFDFLYIALTGAKQQANKEFRLSLAQKRAINFLKKYMCTVILKYELTNKIQLEKQLTYIQ